MGRTVEANEVENMQMTLPELIMSSTILTWIVLSTVYRIKSNKKIFQKLDEIKKLLDRQYSDDFTVTWRAGKDGEVHGKEDI